MLETMFLNLDEGRGASLVVICWTISAIALSFVIARVFTRVKLKSAAGKDDLAIVLAMITELIFCALSTASAATGTGQHQSRLSPGQISTAIKVNVATMDIAPFTFCLPKFATAFLLVRLLQPRRTVVTILFFLLISLIACCIVFGVLIWVQCTPVSKTWDSSVPGTCWQASVVRNFAIFIATYSAFVDLVIALYPATIFMSLQMSSKKKIGMSLLMGLGIFACWTSIYKCTKLPALSNRDDYLYATTDLMIWTSIEANTIILVTTFPTLGPFVTLIITSATSSLSWTKKLHSFPTPPFSSSATSSANQLNNLAAAAKPANCGKKGAKGSSGATMQEFELKASGQGLPAAYPNYTSSHSDARRRPDYGDSSIETSQDSLARTSADAILGHTSARRSNAVRGRPNLDLEIARVIDVSVTQDVV